MPIRSIVRRSAVAGALNATRNTAPVYVDSDDDALKYIPAGTGSTERAFGVSLSTSGFRMAAGTGTLASGTVVVATGLATVLGFTAMLSGTGATATGATEVESLHASSITTGAVTVTGSFLTANAAESTASASGTSAFYWFAVGT